MKISSAVLLLLGLSAVYAANLRINFRRCDRNNNPALVAAEACLEHFCPAHPTFSGSGVNVVTGALDQFSGCLECFDQRCEDGASDLCEGSALRNSCVRPPAAPGATVAVVGGGVSGLFAARYLKRSGYDVTVYEAEDELAATTESLHADGHVYDFATKFVMPNTPLGPMQATMMQMVSDYNMTFRESPTNPQIPSLSWWPGMVPDVAALPHVLLPLVQANPALFVQELIIGHTLLAAMQAVGVRCPADLINFGFAFPNESYADWSTRINLPAFTTLLGFIHDGFLQGESDIQPAAIIVNVRRNMLPPLIKSILLGFGVTAAQIDPVLLPALHALLSDPYPGSSYTFLEGMQEFFDRLADVENLDVKLNSEVRRLRFFNNHVQVIARRQPTRWFDHVVVATKPHQSLFFLRNHPDMQAIMQRASPIEPKVSWAVRATGLELNLGPAYQTFIFPDALSFPPDGSITATAKDFADSDVIFAIGYTDVSVSEADAETEMLSDMAAAGYTVSEVIGGRFYDYPATLSVQEVTDGWYNDAFAQQGVGNVWYVGEIWSGANIPSLLDFVEKTLPGPFPSTTKSVEENKAAVAMEHTLLSGMKQAASQGPAKSTHHWEQLITDTIPANVIAAVEAVPINPTHDYAELIDTLQHLDD